MTYKSVLSIDYDFSVIGMGCRSFGGKDYWTTFSKENATDAVNIALDNGINFFDVAPEYGNGYAESFLGDVIKNKRKNVFIGTKCGLVNYGDDKNKIDLSKASIMRQVDLSLKRLKTDYIDIYQCSWPDPNTDIEETMEALVSLKKMGKINHIGLTNFSYTQITNALRVAKVNAIQGYYNIINRNAGSYFGLSLDYFTERDLFRICYEESMAFFPYSGLFHGLLTDDYEQRFKDKRDFRHEDPRQTGQHRDLYYDLIEKLCKFSKSINKTLSQVALNFLIQKDLVTSVIVGVSNKEQVLSNIKATEFKLSTDELELIDKLVKEFCFATGEIFA